MEHKNSQTHDKPPVKVEQRPMTPLTPEELRHVAGGPAGNPTCDGSH